MDQLILTSDELILICMIIDLKNPKEKVLTGEFSVSSNFVRKIVVAIAEEGMKDDKPTA